MTRKTIYRRQFVQSSGIVAVGIAAAPSATALAAAPGGGAAIPTTNLGAHESETLLAMSRQIFPHPALGDMYYDQVVTAKDPFGLPIPDVHYDDHPNDIAMRNHAYKQGDAVYQAVEAIRTIEVPPYPSTHNLGTCRMSPNPRDGVCNKFGQTHDIANLFISDGSQFTTGGAENPTLTMVTLAIRQADYIADQMSKHQI